MRAAQVSFHLTSKIEVVGPTCKEKCDADSEMGVLANAGFVRLTSSGFPEVVERLHRHGDKELTNSDDRGVQGSDNLSEGRIAPASSCLLEVLVESGEYSCHASQSRHEAAACQASRSALLERQRRACAPCSQPSHLRLSRDLVDSPSSTPSTSSSPLPRLHLLV